jgi:siroheme synthase-like protein
VSAYPLMLDGASLSAVVIGGGAVAARKVAALAEAGAAVHVIAPDVDDSINRVAAANAQIRVTRARYAVEQLADATLVIAATDDAAVNERVANDARRAGRLVNVVDMPQLGNCTTPAVHRSGELVIAVSAGGVPLAAARVRDALGQRFDTRYSTAVRELAALRSRLLDDGRRERWSDAARALFTDDFCELIESERLTARTAEWL